MTITGIRGSFDVFAGGIAGFVSSGGSPVGDGGAGIGFAKIVRGLASGTGMIFGADIGGQ